MAAVTHRVTTPSTTNASTYASGSFTPAVGDLLVVCVTASGTVTNPGSVSSSAGYTFTLVRRETKAASADSLYMYVSNEKVTAASAQTVTFNCTGDAATGAIVSVVSISGMSRTGSSAILKSGGQSNGAAAGTPTVSLGSAALTGNPLVGFVGNATSPANVTQPSGWTELTDATGYSTPVTGQEVASINSGFTGSTVTWGGTSASAFGAIVAEFDTSAVNHVATGDLVGQGSTIAGSATRTAAPVTHATSGALVGQGAVVTGSANNGDLPVVLGTAQLTLGTSANPGAQNITVPAGTQLVVVFVGATGTTAGLNLSLTSDFAGTFTVIDAGVQDGCSIGYAVVSSTGAKTITPSWNETILEGPSFQLAFINNIDTGNFLLEAAAVATGNNTTSATYNINTNGRCILLAQEEQDGSSGIPATMSGYTSLQTQNNNNSGANLQQKQAVSGHPTTITGTGTAYDTLTAITIKRISSAPVSHDTQGTLVGSGATVAGSAQHNALHTSTGALVGQGSTVTGSASRTAGTVTHDATGALVGQGATVTGAAARFRAFATSGALVGQGSVIAGVSARFRAHPTTGALVGPGATIAGTALRFRAHDTTGAIVGSGAAVSGSAQHNVPHSATGALVGSGSTVTGAAARNTTAVTHDTTGALTGSGATVAGAAARERIHATTGALVGQGSTVTGSANRFRAHAATGALVGQGATIDGAARHNVPHAATGALVGDGAQVSGAAVRSGSGVTITGASLDMLREIWARLELDPANPVVITSTTLQVGTIAQDIGTGGAVRTGATLSSSKDPDAAIFEIWQRLGLDPANALIQTTTTIDAGTVHCTVTEAGGTVTVQRT